MIKVTKKECWEAPLMQVVLDGIKNKIEKGENLSSIQGTLWDLYKEYCRGYEERES